MISALYNVMDWFLKVKYYMFFFARINFLLWQNIHKLYHFQVYNSGLLSELTVLCSHHHDLGPEHFHHPKQEVYP